MTVEREQLQECRQNREETVHSVELKRNSIVSEQYVPYSQKYLYERVPLSLRSSVCDIQDAMERGSRIFLPHYTNKRKRSLTRLN